MLSNLFIFSIQWYDLIYYDKSVDYESLCIKLEAKHEKERNKLPDDEAVRQEFDQWDGTAATVATTGQDLHLAAAGPQQKKRQRAESGQSYTREESLSPSRLNLTATVQYTNGDNGGGPFILGDQLTALVQDVLEDGHDPDEQQLP